MVPGTVSTVAVECLRDRTVLLVLAGLLKRFTECLLTGNEPSGGRICCGRTGGEAEEDDDGGGGGDEVVVVVVAADWWTSTAGTLDAGATGWTATEGTTGGARFLCRRPDSNSQSSVNIENLAVHIGRQRKAENPRGFGRTKTGWEVESFWGRNVGTDRAGADWGDLNQRTACPPIHHSFRCSSPSIITNVTRTRHTRWWAHVRRRRQEKKNGHDE